MRILFNDMAAFSKQTFPDATAKEHLKKLEVEVKEALNEPSDISEYADCLLCLFGAASKQGFSYTDLFAAASKKLIINKQRDWQKLEDGTYQHKQ